MLKPLTKKKITKKEALKTIEKLDDDVVVKLAELAKNKKALVYLKSDTKFNFLKSFL